MIELDKFGFIDINTRGTKYDSVRYNPETREIITCLKYSTANCVPSPVKSNMETLYKELEWDLEYAKETYANKIKIIKRIDKFASQYRKQLSIN